MDRLKEKMRSEKGDATDLIVVVSIFALILILAIGAMISESQYNESVSQYNEMCKQYSDLPLSKVPAKCQSYYNDDRGGTRGGTTIMPMIVGR